MADREEGKKLIKKAGSKSNQDRGEGSEKDRRE
jgi:hypothetical protein